MEVEGTSKKQVAIKYMSVHTAAQQYLAAGSLFTLGGKPGNLVARMVPNTYYMEFSTLPNNMEFFVGTLASSALLT